MEALSRDEPIRRPKTLGAKVAGRFGRRPASSSPGRRWIETENAEALGIEIIDEAAVQALVATALAP